MAVSGARAVSQHRIVETGRPTRLKETAFDVDIALHELAMVKTLLADDQADEIQVRPRLRERLSLVRRLIESAISRHDPPPRRRRGQQTNHAQDRQHGASSKPTLPMREPRRPQPKKTR